MRRQLPVLVATSFVAAFAVFLGLAAWHRGSLNSASSGWALVILGLVVAAAGYFGWRRVKEENSSFALLTVEVSDTGIVIENPVVRRTFSSNEVRRVVLHRSWFSQDIAYVGFDLKPAPGHEISGRFIALPPLLDNQSFVRELLAAHPSIPQAERRKLLPQLGA
jgi:hypothetical protein